jgi:hypothetical protein
MPNTEPMMQLDPAGKAPILSYNVRLRVRPR